MPLLRSAPRNRRGPASGCPGWSRQNHERQFWADPRRAEAHIRAFPTQGVQCRAASAIWNDRKATDSLVTDGRLVPFTSASAPAGALQNAVVSVLKAIVPSGQPEHLFHHEARLRSGSCSTRLSLLNSMVSRDPAEYAGHRGSCGTFGLPVRANATHAALTFSARA